MADTMIERVAREMFRQRRRDQGAAYFGGQDEVETDWRTVKSLYIADARAIIAAMREPTDAMTKAGGETAPWSYELGINDGFTPESAAAGVWEDMIDAALAEEG